MRHPELAVLFSLLIAAWAFDATAGSRIDPRLPDRPAGMRYALVPARQLWMSAETHACVTGTAQKPRKQEDGDFHVVLVDGSAKVVLEFLPTVPWLRAPAGDTPQTFRVLPRAGERITACGIVRFDRRHKWQELHPVEVWWPVQ